nr:hypothetical protein [Lachnospiraceae bacterium]
TTYVKEMIRDYAHLNTGGKIFEEEEMRFDAVDNTMRGGLGWATPFMDVYTLNQMAGNAREADPSYAGYGNMKVTKDEIQQYKKSRKYFNPVKKGYSPAVSGENLRRISGENKGILGSYYYYRDLEVQQPSEPKAHPNASNLINVSYDDVESKLADTGMELSNAILALLPTELRDNPEVPLPPDVHDFAQAATLVSDPFAALIIKCKNNVDALKDQEIDAEYEDAVTFDDIKAAYAGLQGFEKRINKGFTQTFQGDTRLETPVMNTLSMISIAFHFINRLYQDKAKKTQKQSADLGDIRSQMNNLFRMKIGDKSITISATHYESYLAIYRSPKAAFAAYSRLVQLRQADKDETITDDEKKELEKLEDIDGNADDFDQSHNYLLGKDVYSQQDLDYIFKLKAREKKGLENVEAAPFNSGKSSAAIYQALVMDKIFGGIKAAYLRDMEVGDCANPVVVKAWLNQYIAENAWSHKKELEMVVRAIRRVTPRHTEETLYKYVAALMSTIYLPKVFPFGETGEKLEAAGTMIPMQMQDIMEEKRSAFPTLLKAIIRDIMAERV